MPAAKTLPPKSASKAAAKSTALAHRPRSVPAHAEARAPVTMLEVIARAASDPKTDVAKLERLMAMAHDQEARMAKKAFGIAMKEAQDGMRRVRADASNSQTSSKYATYAALDKAVRPIYTQHGFALTFDTGEGAPTDHIRVICEVFHEAGHARPYHIDMPADGKGAKGGDVMTKTHAAGSALTYGQRYLLKAIFNIVVGDDDDDDGNAAGDVSVTAEQLDELRELLAKSKGDPELFCKYMKVASMGAIQQRDLPKAREALNNAIATYSKKNQKDAAQ
jgi:hypothetical protein